MNGMRIKIAIGTAVSLITYASFTWIAPAIGDYIAKVKSTTSGSGRVPRIVADTDLIYARDRSAGLCFAVIVSGFYQNVDSHPIPCDALKRVNARRIIEAGGPRTSVD